ncbi:hypothetical protein C8D70_12320 [Chryseobacterium sp. CBTAP 102]|uniref:hypothetical protein n=1 Tax=Chryseobacterium sp. CBTAP 102 TaxID=2135644 RepID=UPI000D7544D9|nr:hypothetical protein [Chryseobacterium sp. CBTAP 102]PXW07105.1 hypothetical protein C8D70_12320 [Chryseobacterium sp. CBTAP 102]
MKKVLSVKKTLTVTLSIGEITISDKDILKLKPLLDQAFIELDDSAFYKKILGMKPVEQVKELEDMTDEDLINLAKANDLYSSGGQVYSNFTIKIWKELFKRVGLGYKQVNRYLSFAQSSYLEGLGLKSRIG